ncbi:MAG: HD domain-containing phosphohydrolase [Thermodesulfobacteriota bacterium]
MTYKRYPLYIPISALILVLILASCFAIATYMFSRSVATIQMVTQNSFIRVIQQTNSELQISIRSPLAVVSTGSRYLELVRAESLEERLEHLSYLREALLSLPNMASIYLGYPDGEFFLLRRIDNVKERAVFQSPDDCYWLVQSLERDRKGKVLKHEFIYLDKELNPLSSRERNGAVEYDPRNRPWYLEAVNSVDPIRSDPYLFASSEKLGITFARRSLEVDGVVVGVDIRLQSISKMLPRYLITPGSKVALFDGHLRLIACLEPSRMIKQNGEDDHAEHLMITDLQEPLYDSLIEAWQEGGRQDLDVKEYRVSGDKWLASLVRLHFSVGPPAYMVIGVPYSELYAGVRKARNKSALITLAIMALTIPLGFLAALAISRPIKGLTGLAHAARRFDFSKRKQQKSIIVEVDELSSAMGFLNQTIGDFLELTDSLNKEKDFDSLLERISKEAMKVAGANGVFTYLMDEKEDCLRPGLLCVSDESCSCDVDLPDCDLDSGLTLIEAFRENRVRRWILEKDDGGPFVELFAESGQDYCTIWCLPLVDRQGNGMGVIGLFYNSHPEQIGVDHLDDRLAFVHRMSGLAGVSLETRQLIQKQKDLFDAFIRLIAGAIDAKSPYTGGHCQRVPEIAKMLAQAACDEKEGVFGDFDLSEEQWEELHVAAWLHDCGKVTTPEYVVDKATKLETIYDRIHEVRMRFEVLKRDTMIDCLEQIIAGGDEQKLKQELSERLAELDDDFCFIAGCNEGGEFMAPELVERLHAVAGYSWQRTLDDRIGISWEEGTRKDRSPSKELPVEEKLLSDREEHLFFKQDWERIRDDNPWGFKLDEPEYHYNHGEIHNLQVNRGTLSEEERFKINDHIVQTIKMLGELPYPKHLKGVPEIAGGHHETMVGTGYPRKLTGDQMSITAKIMVIADVFEALTASDRPYKKAKTLSEAVKIMQFMHKDGHFDSDLFDLFLTSGVHNRYGEQYLAVEQLDEVDVESLLS